MAVNPVPEAVNPAPETTSLARASVEFAADGSQVAAALLEEALGPAGAAAVALWLIAPDGGLELAGEAGFGPREASRWRRIPPGMSTLPQRAASTGAEFWWMAGRPEDDPVPLIGRWPGGARAALPLRSAERMLGALEACWAQPVESFPAALRRQLAVLAEVAARALGSAAPDGDLSPGYQSAWLFGLLDGLHESVLYAYALRDAAGSVTDFRIDQVSTDFRDPAGRPGAALVGRSLLEAYPSAALPGGLLDCALGVLATGEPVRTSGEVVSSQLAGAALAPMLTVRIAQLFDGVAIAWRHTAEAERLAMLLGHAQRLGRLGGWEEILATGSVHWTEPTFALFGRAAGDPVRLADLDGQVPPEDMPAVHAFRASLLRDKTVAAAAFRIIRGDDGSVRQIRAFAEPVTDASGTLIAVRGAYQDVSAHYHTEMALAATRDRLADTEERAAEEHRLALRLQQAITPQSSGLVEAAGLDVAARYRPAGHGHLVSGDWYDAVLLPNKEVLLVVGDVAGHGLDAVTGMVALRNHLRGLAITGAAPATLLTWLNGAACHLAGTIGTAVCGCYDPVTRTLRWARAGHLPPVLIRDGQAYHLGEPRGLLLGADPDARYQEETTSLRLGDTLLMFTDGLIERRNEPIDEAVAALLRFASQPVADISSFADLLLTWARSNTGDDACLVAVSVR